jgi:hypothetical protein
MRQSSAVCLSPRARRGRLGDFGIVHIRVWLPGSPKQVLVDPRQVSLVPRHGRFLRVGGLIQVCRLARRRPILFEADAHPLHRHAGHLRRRVRKCRCSRRYRRARNASGPPLLHFPWHAQLSRLHMSSWRSCWRGVLAAPRTAKFMLEKPFFLVSVWDPFSSTTYAFLNLHTLPNFSHCTHRGKSGSHLIFFSRHVRHACR